jgi:hypothetical protein
MTVWHTHVPSYVGADPIWNVLLVHGVWMRIAIAEVSAWSGEIKSGRLSGRFNAVGKLRGLTRMGIRVGRVAEVKVTRETIVIRSRCQHWSSIFFLSSGSPNLYAFVKVVWMSRTVCLWSNYFLWGRNFLPKFELLSLWWGFTDHKVRNFIVGFNFVSGRSRVSIVN